MAGKHLLGNNQLNSSYPTESNSDKKPKSNSVMGHTMPHQSGSSSNSYNYGTGKKILETGQASPSPPPSNNAKDNVENVFGSSTNNKKKNQLKSSNPTESKSDQKTRSNPIMRHTKNKGAAENILQPNPASSSPPPSINANDNAQVLFESTNKNKKK